MDIEAVRDRWRALGFPIRPGVSDAAILDFESRHGVHLPAEVRKFYTCIDGMEYGSTDEELISFWPLAEVGPASLKLANFRGIPDCGYIESTLPEVHSYFVFADFLIWSHVYAVRLSPDPHTSNTVILIANSQYWRLLASSFGEFFSRYAACPESVLRP